MLYLNFKPQRGTLRLTIQRPNLNNLIKHIKLRKNYYLGRDLVFFLTKEKLFKIHIKNNELSNKKSII